MSPDEDDCHDAMLGPLSLRCPYTELIFQSYGAAAVRDARTDGINLLEACDASVSFRFMDAASRVIRCKGLCRLLDMGLRTGRRMPEWSLSFFTEQCDVM